MKYAVWLAAGLSAALAAVFTPHAAAGEEIRGSAGSIDDCLGTFGCPIRWDDGSAGTARYSPTFGWSFTKSVTAQPSSELEVCAGRIHGCKVRWDDGASGSLKHGFRGWEVTKDKNRGAVSTW